MVKMCGTRCQNDMKIVFTFHKDNLLRGIQRPAAFAIVCFVFVNCDQLVIYYGSYAEQIDVFAQSILVFVLPLSVKANSK